MNVGDKKSSDGEQRNDLVRSRKAESMPVPVSIVYKARGGPGKGGHRTIGGWFIVDGR